jgi:galactokinase
MGPNIIHTSTPGRIYLFGEHQDYLGLPVIAIAINKRVLYFPTFIG